VNKQDRELSVVKARQKLLFGMFLCVFLMIVLPAIPQDGGENRISISFLVGNVLPTIVLYLIIHYLVLPYWPRIKDWFNN
jgi:hypothetical protein